MPLSNLSHDRNSAANLPTAYSSHEKLTGRSINLFSGNLTLLAQCSINILPKIPPFVNYNGAQCSEVDFQGTSHALSI